VDFGIHPQQTGSKAHPFLNLEIVAVVVLLHTNRECSPTMLLLCSRQKKAAMLMQHALVR